MSRLGAIVDGSPLPEAEAAALWDRFSRWMEEHRGDLAGFAKQEGFASVHPGVDGDRPVLRISKTDPQKPYAPVRAKPAPATPRRPVEKPRDDRPSGLPGGSAARHPEGRRPDRGGSKRPGNAGKQPK